METWSFDAREGRENNATRGEEMEWGSRVKPAFCRSFINLCYARLVRPAHWQHYTTCIKLCPAQPTAPSAGSSVMHISLCNALGGFMAKVGPASSVINYFKCSLRFSATAQQTNELSKLQKNTILPFLQHIILYTDFQHTLLKRKKVLWSINNVNFSGRSIDHYEPKQRKFGVNMVRVP